MTSATFRNYAAWAAVTLIIAALIIGATEVAAEATHRSTGPCPSCSWWNWLCRATNYWENRCYSGH